MSHLQLAKGISMLNIAIANRNKPMIIQRSNLIRGYSLTTIQNITVKLNNFLFRKVSGSNQEAKSTDFFIY